MDSISGFKIIDIASESEGCTILHAQREQDRHYLLIKRATAKHTRVQVLDRLKWEMQVLEPLKLAGVPAVEGICDVGGEPLLLLEHFEGVGWDRLPRPDLVSFFEVAIAVVGIVGEIHARALVHRSINPANILVSPTTREVRLIGFGYASRLSQEFSDYLELSDQVDDFGFIAPEQTGRMNCDVDYRSDWYALGACFYRILSGYRPFPGKDPLDTVYAHIARHPRSLHLLEPRVPEMLAQIVAKLMAKQPEERYQSKHGLIADLRECQRQYAANGTIERFELGRADVGTNFCIPRKLYGRAEEVERLLQIFDGVATGGKSLCLIYGQAGSGKSSLVWEVHRPIAARHGYFLSGKFDQFSLRLPYSAFLQAFRGVVRQILASGKDQVAFWRKAITESAGANGKLLVDVIPELVMLIGERPDVPSLPPLESQHRFNSVFGNFIRLFARKEHPLLLFLDDLQWADVSSLQMIESILLDPELSHLMLIGSYREQELEAGHPLHLTLETLRKGEFQVVDLPIRPLGRTSVIEVLTDTLGSGAPELSDLAQICHQKTDGNPFFLRQFLLAIYARKLIYFDTDSGQWKWSIKEIGQSMITENVAELLSARIKQLPYATFSLLKLAACIGSQFDLATLSLVGGMSLLETRDALWPALDGGLIRPRNERYKFVNNERDANLVYFHFLHDRIQQAAYAQIHADRLARTHLEIGRALLVKLSPAERDKRLFELVNHLLQGVSLIRERAERFTLASLLLRAGMRAKESSVFKLSSEYLESALGLVEQRDWQEQYRFMRELHLEAAEIYYIHHRLDEMERLLDEVLKRAKEPEEKRRVYEIRITGYVNNYDWENAYKAGIDGLKALGLVFPEVPDRPQSLNYLAEAAAAMDRVGLDRLAQLPQMSDELMLNQVRLLSVAMTPIFHLDPNLFVMLAARFVTLTMRGGHMELSSYLYATYCIVVVDVDPERALAVGEVALELANRYPSSRARGRTLFTIHANVSFRKQPLTALVPLFLEPYATLIECGDLEFAAYAVLYHLKFAFLAGAQTLPELEHLFDRWCRVLKRLVIGQPAALIYYQGLLDLTGKSSGTQPLHGNLFDLPNYEQMFQEKSDIFSLCLLYTNELMIAYLLGQYDRAWQAAEKARAVGVYETHEVNTSIYMTFAALTRLRRCQQLAPAEREPLLAEVARDQGRMAEWAKEAPANFLARWHLVEAERARLLGDRAMATAHFDQAVALCAKHTCLWERALINESLGLFWLSLECHHLAGVFLRRAGAAWASWGAYGKLRALRQEHGALLDPPADESHKRSERGWHEFDLGSVIKATQVISSEIVLGDVLERLVQIAMENAGAQRGFLLVEREGRWFVAAQGDPDHVRFLQDRMQPMEESEQLSRGICRFVANTGEAVLLQDASESEIWDNDPYVRLNRPKSLLCLAIAHKGTTAAVLYLENNLRRAVFTENHRRVLGMLATQAAISLENAALYADLERKVEERTVQLRYKTDQLLGSIRYAKRIQEGILQDPSQFECPELRMFVTYLPKDIVSGDLYWFSRRGEHLFSAAIDCTGHGVPGALMSMVGQILINQVFNEQRTCDPGKLLEDLSQRIRQALAIETARSADGMEICCCCVDLATRKVLFAGARRPIYLARGGEIIEIRGTRRSLGDEQRPNHGPFVNHELDLCPGDTLYLTTDGYADQSDEEGRRMGKNHLKKLLAEISAYAPSDQNRMLQQHLSSYRGEMAQRDDVTIIGLQPNLE